VTVVEEEVGPMVAPFPEAINVVFCARGTDHDRAYESVTNQTTPRPSRPGRLWWC